MAKDRRIEVTPVMLAGGAYVSGDEVGAPFEILGVVDYPGKGGKITGVTIVDQAAQALALDLLVFQTQPVGVADNAAFDVTDADALKMIGQVSIVAGDYIGGASNKTAYKDVDIDFETPAASTSLWGILVTRGAPTYPVGALRVILHVVQEDEFGH